MVILTNFSCLSMGFLIAWNWSRQDVISFVDGLRRRGLLCPASGPLQSGSGRSVSGVPCLHRTLPSNGQALNPLCSLRLGCLLHLPMPRLSL